MTTLRAMRRDVDRARRAVRAGAALPPEDARLRDAARASLLEFTRQTHHDYRANWHHCLLCDELEAWARTPDSRLVVSMPPRHGKSQVVSRALPAWLLGHDPDAEIILTSYGASLAKDMCQDVQRIMDDRAYARAFPATRLAARNSGEAVRRADAFGVVGRRGVLRAAGAGGPITGKGGRFLIVDDPHKNRAEAESPVVRGRVAKWYNADLATRCEPGGHVLVCQTRWHEEDLVGTLLALQGSDPKADRWEVLRLPAVLTGEDGKHPGDPRRPGEPLWPERYPLDRLEKIRARSEYDWWSLYQGDPRQGAASEWPASHFGEHLWFSDWPHLALRGVAVDASKGVGEDGDYTAIVAGGLGLDGHLYAEAWLERLPPEGVTSRAVDVAAAWKPDVVGVEANLFQELFLVMMQQEAASRGVPFPVVPVVNMVPKEVRIRRLGPDLAGRKLHFRATPGTRMLVDQLRQFPLASHDDGPDALEMFKRVLVELWNGKRRGNR